MKISYEQGLDRDFYTAVVGSETFKGAAFDAGAGSAYATNFSGDSFYMASSSGNFVSTLIGDKGSTMRCRMNYVDSSGMTNFGGNGVCEHSDGRIFDVVW